MFIRKWNGRSIINHILSRRGRKSLNSHYYARTYPDVYAAAERIFGSWGCAIGCCGLDYGKIRKYRVWSRETVIDEIIKMHEAKQPLNSNHIQKNDKPLYMAAIKRFGNWGSALDAVGAEYGKIRLRRKLSRKDIREEILALYRSGVDLAYPNMRENYHYLLAAGMKKLGGGSWTEARKKCGICLNYRMYSRKNDTGEQMMESA